MRDGRFDDLSRRFASGDDTGTRRGFLRAIGLGGVAATLGPTLAGAAPATPATGVRTRRQAAPSQPTIDELAFSLEYDIDRIFRFVRDEVIYDPYPGMLRGATGTLWGLAGNALDQAVLLRGLLDAALVPTRLVAGALDEAAVASLLAAGELDASTRRSRGQRLLVRTGGEDLEPTASTPDQLAFEAQFPDFAAAFTATVERCLAEGIATVQAGLLRAGIDLPTATVELPEEERRRHVWVQYASGTEWVDLDPSFPGAEAGGVFSTAATPLEAVPEELVHRVSLRLSAEQVAGGEVVRTELLTFERAASELVGVPLTLFHPMPESMEQVGLAVGGLIQGFRNFVPTLLVGEETIFGAPVTFGTGGGLLDAFGGEAVEGDTLAEWLEVGVTTPTGTTTVVRTVFDRVGEETRAAGPVDPTSVAPVALVDAGDVESSFLPLAGMWAIGVVGGTVPVEVVDRAPSEEPTVDDLLLALQVYHYAREVYALGAPSLAKVRTLCDAPNVTAIVQRPLDVTAGGQKASVGIDLLHRSVRSAPGAPSGEVHPLVAAGVLGHAVEQAFLEVGSSPPLSLPVTAFSSVSRVFAEAEAEGIGVVVLPPGDDAAGAPAMAAGPSRLVRAARAEGKVVIVPERPVALGGRERVGWWVVDPATGATMDAMDDGGGSVATEYALLAMRIAGCILMFVPLGIMVYAVAQLAADATYGGGSGGSPGKAAVLGAGGTAAGGALCAG